MLYLPFTQSEKHWQNFVIEPNRFSLQFGVNSWRYVGNLLKSRQVQHFDGSWAQIVAGKSIFLQAQKFNQINYLICNYVDNSLFLITDANGCKYNPALAMPIPEAKTSITRIFNIGGLFGSRAFLQLRTLAFKGSLLNKQRYRARKESRVESKSLKSQTELKMWMNTEINLS